MRALLVVLTILGGVSAMAAPEFVNHGVAAPIAELRGAAALRDGNGRNVVAMVPLDQSVRGYLLVVDVDSGETTQVPYPEGVPFAGAFASLLSKNGKFYTGEAGFLMEFDPTSRQFTFFGKPHPESEHFVGQAVIDGPDGQIWIGTYSKSHLVAYNPQTHAFTDYGSLDPEEHYFNYLAYDDAGWFYGGIGTARMSLVACNPKTGEKKQLLPDAQRVVGTAQVFRGTDGKVYGVAGANYYRLSGGQAEAVTRAQFAPAVPTGQTGYGGRTGSFPDGRTYRVNLEEGWVEAVDPKTNAAKRLTLQYKSGGSYLTSMVVGPDGRLYTSSSHPMHFSYYDPATDKMTDLGPVANVGGGNFCAMTVQGKYLAAPSYSNGIFHLYDTSRPYNGGYGEDPNPREVARWPEDICRPRTAVAHPDGKHVFMAGYAGYGRVGGGLGIYDIEADQATLIKHEQLIPNQSTIALKVLPDGNLLGGTTIEAPGGGHVQAKEGVIYVYDWRQGKVLQQAVPVPEAGSVLSLEVGSDGLVYGLASGPRLFVYDLAKRQVVHTADLSEYGDVPRGPNLKLMPDGSIYGAFTRAIVKIAPATFAVTKLATPPADVTMGIAVDKGRMYFAHNAEVWSYRLP